jgi:hypothetical protein
MKDEITTSEDDLEGQLTEVSETVHGDLLQSVFSEWMSRLECVTERKGEYFTNPH